MAAPDDSNLGVELLELVRLAKAFGETRALTSVSITCDTGTVHTVLGENGSGKSTLVKILAGIVAPDAGTILLDGQQVTPSTPDRSHQLGIAAVLQEVLVAPDRSVLENIFLGYDGILRRRIQARQRRVAAAAALRQITNAHIDLDFPTGRLPLSQQQLVVIARALVRDPTILILDEATAALDVEDRSNLFATIRGFVARGRIVIFISHRMDEVVDLSDRVTILRNGEAVATIAHDELDPHRLLALMSPAAAAIDRRVDV